MSKSIREAIARVLASQGYSLVTAPAGAYRAAAAAAMEG